MDYNGMCIKGCPERYVVGPGGKCKFKDYTHEVNSKYFQLAAIILASIALIVTIYFIYVRYFKRLPYVEIQSQLAVSMAKINNLNEEKEIKDMVVIGVGTDPDNINDWVNEIWQNYVKREDKLLRKVDFAKFVKNIFRITNSIYEPTDRNINKLFEMIKLKEGKADR